MKGHIHNTNGHTIKIANETNFVCLISYTHTDLLVIMLLY